MIEYMSSSIDETTKPKSRATRTRTSTSSRARKTIEEEELPKKRVTRPRVKKVFDEDILIEEELAPSRRAPTNINISSEKRSPKKLLFVFGISILLAGFGIFIGMSDEGQIDVVAVVNERNERINRGEVREGESDQIVTIPAGRPNLRPATQATVPTPEPTPEPVAEPVATSTEEEVVDAEGETIESTDESSTTPPSAETVTEAEPI